jgi:endonuclease/exonuclease/phosphatase family metal-dependent hydrolase
MVTPPLDEGVAHVTHRIHAEEGSRVKWIDAVSPNHSARNDRWRRGVGDPLVANYAQPADRPVDQMAIVSWNVHVGSADVDLFLGHLREGRLTGGAPVQDFVMLVQETFRSGAAVPNPMPAGAISANPILYPDSRGERHDAESIARSAGLFVAYLPSMRNGPRPNPRTGECEDRGNAIFSTIPLDDISGIELPLLTQRRVAVLGHLRGRTSGDAPVDLQVGSLHFDLKATPWGRSAQARAVARAADAPACIIAGDLNVLPWFEDTLSILTKAYPQSVHSDLSPTHRAAIDRRIDFQFCRIGDGWHALPYTRVPDLYGSDHYPLIGFVKFSPAR